MSHPLLHLSARQRARLFWLFLALTAVVMLAMQLIGAPLSTEAAPAGIVSFELAGSVENAQSMIASWDATARIYAGFSLGLDYLFMVAYSMAIALGCLWAAGFGPGWWVRLGIGLAWGQWLAALLDAVENASLWQVLLSPANPWPQLARWCAIFKFALILAGLLFVVTALLRKLFSRMLDKTAGKPKPGTRGRKS